MPADAASRLAIGEIGTTGTRLIISAPAKCWRTLRMALPYCLNCLRR